MSKIRFEMKRVLFVNGVRLNFGSKMGHFPTKEMLEGLEECHVHGNPWCGYWIEDFTVKTVVEDTKVYARYDVKAVSQKAKIGA